MRQSVNVAGAMRVCLLAVLAACGSRETTGDSPGDGRGERVSPTAVLYPRGGGRVTAVISLGPTAFADEAGRWHPIETTLSPGPGGFTAERNVVATRYPAALSSRTSVRFEERRSHRGFDWRPRWAADGRSARLEVAGSVARYRPGEGVAEELTVLRGAVKHSLVLASREAMERWLTAAPDGTLSTAGTLTLDPGLWLEPVRSPGEPAFVTSGPIDVMAESGAVLQLAAPRVYELEGLRREAPARYRWSPGSGELAIEIDAAWLRASDRTFPLAVDPPATALTGYHVHPNSNNVNGPGWLNGGPDAPRLGALGAVQFYQWALKFDVSAIGPGATITAVSMNTFFDANGSGSIGVHYARLTLDPQTTEPSALWVDGTHLAHPDYATIASQAAGCNCWINGGNPATQTGTTLNATAVADLQAALPSGRFLMSVHVPTYNGNLAYADGMLEANGPQLYVDYAAALPTVTYVTPESTPAGTAVTAVVLGTNFQSGIAASLVRVGGGAPTPLFVTYVSAGKIRVAVPSTVPMGVYDVTVNNGTGPSPATPADRVSVLGPAMTWTGSSSSAWSSPSNWSPAGVPDSNTDVTIPAATPQCALDLDGGTAHAVRITGGVLATSGRDLTVTQDLAIESGRLDMGAGGTVLVQGNYVATAGGRTGDAGTVELSSPSPLRETQLASGRVLLDDFERGAPGWSATVTSGAPVPWVLQEVHVSSPARAWHQRGLQLIAGAAALTSPAFSLAGRSTATLRWRQRFRIATPSTQANDGFAVQVSTDGVSWTSIAPHAGSAGRRLPKVGCGGTPNPVAAGPAGLFTGLQPDWVSESVSLDAYAGQPNVRIRFWSGWDACSNSAPSEGVYIDDVLVTADEAPLSLHHLRLSAATRASARAALDVGGDVTVGSGTVLELDGRDLAVGGALQNAGTLERRGAGAFSAGSFTNSGRFEMGLGAVTSGPLVNSGTFTGGTGALSAASVSTSGTLSTGNGATVITGSLSVTGGVMRVRGPTLSVGGDLVNDGALHLGDALLTLAPTAAANVTGTGSYAQSRARTLLFSDGFESGAFTAGGWVLQSGPGTSLDGQVVMTPPGAGTRVACLNCGGASRFNYLRKAVSTAGRSGIWLRFGRATAMTANMEQIHVQYSTDDGATWKIASTVSGAFGYTLDAINLSAVDPAVDDNPLFRFGFHSVQSGGATNRHYVDDVRLEAGTPGLGPVTVDSSGSVLVNPGNAANRLVITGPLTVSRGTLRVATAKALHLDSLLPATSTVAAPGTLDVEGGATLALSGATTLTVAGTLELVGVGGSRAFVTSTDTATPGRWALTVNGTFNGDLFDVAYGDAAGLNLAAGATVTALRSGAFHRPPPSGALLTLAVPVAASALTLENEGGAAGAAGVDGSINGSVIRIDASTGALAGEAFDRDFMGQTPGNVTWGPAGLGFVTPSQLIAAGSCVAITVQAQDASGSVSPVAADVTIALTATPPAGAAFHGDAACMTPATASATIAAPGSAVTFYFRPTVAGMVTVGVSATGLAPASQPYTVGVGPPSRLAFAVQPQRTAAGQAITPAVEVTVTDAAGNTVTSSSAQVTAVLAANPAAGTLSGTLMRTAVNGVATFADLTIDRAGAGYQLGASSAGLGPATSSMFTIDPGAPSALAFVTPPSTSSAGVAIAPPVRVAVVDALGNTVSSASPAVALALGNNPGGATLGGATLVPASSGVAAFPGISVNRPGMGYTLVASSLPLTPAVSPAFDVGVGPPAQLTFTVQPSNAVAGAPIVPAVQVEVRDAAGNVAAGSTVVTLTLMGGAATLGGVLSQPATSGSAVFSGLSVDRAGTGYRLAAGAPGLPQALSAAFDVAAGQPGGLAFATPPRTAVVGDCSEELSVEVRDALGNPARLTAAAVFSVEASPPGLQFFSTVDCGPPALTQLAAAAGETRASFRFRGSTSGSPRVRVAEPQLGEATQSQTLLRGGAGLTVTVAFERADRLHGTGSAATALLRLANRDAEPLTAGRLKLDTADFALGEVTVDGGVLDSDGEGLAVLPEVPADGGLEVRAALTVTAPAERGRGRLTAALVVPGPDPEGSAELPLSALPIELGGCGCRSGGAGLLLAAAAWLWRRRRPA